MFLCLSPSLSLSLSVSISLCLSVSVCVSLCLSLSAGGAVAQSVELANPGEEVPRSIPTVAACSLLFGSMSL